MKINGLENYRLRMESNSRSDKGTAWHKEGPQLNFRSTLMKNVNIFLLRVPLGGGSCRVNGGRSAEDWLAHSETAEEFSVVVIELAVTLSFGYFAELDRQRFSQLPYAFGKPNKVGISRKHYRNSKRNVGQHWIGKVIFIEHEELRIFCERLDLISVEINSLLGKNQPKRQDALKTFEEFTEFHDGNCEKKIDRIKRKYLGAENLKVVISM